MAKLDVKAAALGLGVSWGACMLLLGWVAAFGWGATFVNVMASLYIGFVPGFLGGIIGGAWGFVDGAVGGAIIAYFYNLFAKA